MYNMYRYALFDYKTMYSSYNLAFDCDTYKTLSVVV